MFQCHDEGSAGPSSRGRSGGPGACGLVESRTGYACLMQQLIETWRAAWSVEPNTTPASFPFGVVTLAGGTSEGFDNNMGAFRYCLSTFRARSKLRSDPVVTDPLFSCRWAQTGNTGFLPNSKLPGTFHTQVE